MSAERKTSNGAPFWICAKKLPDDPNDTVDLDAGRCARTPRTSSGNTVCRSDAAAIGQRAGLRLRAGTGAGSSAAQRDAGRRRTASRMPCRILRIRHVAR